MMQAMPDILILLMMNMCMLIEGGKIMEVNNVKENLKMKQTYKEIKKNKKQEFFSELKEIFNSSEFKYIVVNIILAIIIVLCSYICFNFIVPIDYDSVSPDKRIILKIFIGSICVLCVPLAAFVLRLVESKIQDLVIGKKLSKMSYKKMQYIPLTKSEFIKLEIHNITDYVIFLNDFLKAKIKYFDIYAFETTHSAVTAAPPQMILDKINESLIFLEKLPESNQQITFDKKNEKFIIGGR
jgi:hypothetical protein